MPIEIVPALLVRSKEELEEGLRRLRGAAPWVQIDFAGGNYMEGEESFPWWEEFNFEADLMLRDQERAAEALVQLGAARVVVHAHDDAQAALQVLQKYREGEFAIGVGVALHPGDIPEALKEFDGLYDYAQVMGIAREGAQGEPPDARAIELIAALRAAYPHLCIQADGAVAPRVEELVAAGANRLVVGSAIARADNPKAAYKELYTRANGS